MIYNCEKCNKIYKRNPSRKGRFCSNLCCSEVKKKMIPWNKGKSNIYMCELCNKSYSRVPAAKGKFCSSICFGISKGFQKGRISWNKNIKGYMAKEKHWNWKNNRNEVKTDTKVRQNDPLYKQWRMAVRNRDRWICRIADVNCDGRLETHHIPPWKNFPELRYEVNNGITLCHAHHPRKRDDEAKLSSYFQKLVAEMN